MLSVGDRVPDFTLLSGFPDGSRKEVSSRDWAGKTVVLEFFPLAFTRVCTAQMCEARDAATALDALGVEVYGFSCDSAPANAAFALQNRLAHPIVSDPNREVVDALWATQTVVAVRRVPKRGWMIVHRGRVAALWHTEDPGEWRGIGSVEEALAALERP